MFDLLWLTNFIKTGINLSVGTKFARIYNLGPRPSIRSNCLHNLHARFALSAKFHKNWGTFQFWSQTSQMSDFRSRSSIPINIFLISMFDLYWLPYFIKIRHIAILRPNLPKLLILGHWLLVVTARYRLLLLIPTFSMNNNRLENNHDTLNLSNPIILISNTVVTRRAHHSKSTKNFRNQKASHEPILIYTSLLIKLNVYLFS